MQLVLPQQLVTEELTKLHDPTTGGHLGAKQNYCLKECAPDSTRRVVEEWCKTCQICAARKSKPKKHKAPLHIEPAKYPLEQIAVDILDPLPKTEHENKYILINWKEAYPMSNMKVTTVTNILVQEFVSCFGVPKYLHTDKGQNYTPRCNLEDRHNIIKAI